MHKQERTAILLIIGVLILLAISTYLIEAAGKEAFAVPFSDTRDDGTLAVLTGTVTTAANTRTGGHLMLTVNNTSVFVPDGALDEPEDAVGHHLRAIGTVQTYRGEKEIIVASPDDITIREQ